MFVVAISKSAWHAVGERIASFLIAVYHTASERGQVKLTSRDWRAEPLVEFNLLSDRRDLERLMQAFRMMGKLYATPAMQGATSDPFPATYSDRVRKIGVVNTKNKLLTAVAGALLDGPAALRSYLIRKVITEGFAFEDVMADDEACEAFVRKAAIGVWHASCSCRMGADGDPMAVTDPQGRVRGVERPARGRCLDLPAGALRQHQLPDADDGGEDRRWDCAGGEVAHPRPERASAQSRGLPGRDRIDPMGKVPDSLR